MPIVILIVGIILIVVGLNDRITDLKNLLTEDFNPTNGKPSFLLWIVAIFLVGALGYSKTLKPVSNMALALVVVSIVLARRGFIDQFMSAIKG